METYIRGALLILLLLPSPMAWAQNQHDYFDWLAQKPSRIVANSYRTQAEIDRDSAPKWRPNPMVKYDNVEDAAKITFAENVTNLTVVNASLDNSGHSNSLPDFEYTDGNLLFTWDFMYDSGFLILNNGDDLVWPRPTFKNFQAVRNGSPLDKRRFEIKTVFNTHDEDPNHIGSVSYRTYEWMPQGGITQPAGQGGCPQYPSGDCQIGEFVIDANVWTRHWVFIDYDGGTVSAWVADENRAPVVMFDQMPVTFDVEAGLPVNGFWFQYNSSQQRKGPEIYAWFRNFVVLRNVSNVDAIVAQGKKVVGGISNLSPPNSDTIPPASPTSLFVQ